MYNITKTSLTGVVSLFYVLYYGGLNFEISFRGAILHRIFFCRHCHGSFQKVYSLSSIQSKENGTLPGFLPPVLAEEVAFW